MIVSPGANQVLVLQSGMLLGHRAAAYNVLGVASSMLIHALLAGGGVSLLIMQSPGLLNSVKGIGAAYIVYLSAQSIVSAYRLYNQKRSNTAQPEACESGEEPVSVSFKKGFISNIFNVQTSFIFLSIFPQYMNPQSGLFFQSFFLTGIFIALLLIWYSLLISLITTVREHLLQPRLQVAIKLTTGILLLAMGIKIFVR
ncbi:MAG: LysE family translocator [Negativicutes bacterium]|nr:LysE family translocator [Negativicutes bacterium]